MEGCDAFWANAIIKGYAIDCPGGFATLQGINDDDAVGLLDGGERIEKSGSYIEHRDMGRQGVLLEGASNVNTHTLVAEKKIAHA